MCDVSRPVLPQPGPAPGGPAGGAARAVRRDRSTLFDSRAFAVCDHQLAHVYVADPADWPRVRELLAGLPGVARVLAGEERAEFGSATTSAAGELVAAGASRTPGSRIRSGSTTAQAPDYARTVDIHRKPGYDPCELFFDPKLLWPKGRACWRLLQKKLGFRTLFDVVPLDAGLVRGSHGLPAADALDRPLLIGDGPAPAEAELPMTAVRESCWRRWGWRFDPPFEAPDG